MAEIYRKGGMFNVQYEARDTKVSLSNDTGQKNNCRPRSIIIGELSRGRSSLCTYTYVSLDYARAVTRLKY